jgi:hypothetical protein
MGYSEGDLRAAVSAGVIDSTSAEKHIGFLAAREPSAAHVPVPKFDAAATLLGLTVP